MEQFSLEKYLANPSRKVVTREGCPVRILCTNRKGAYPIVALVENHDSDNEDVYSYRENGLYSLFSLSEENNLFFAPETHEGWINVYRNNDSHAYAGAVYDSKEDAEKRKIIDENYVTTIKIEWEE